MALAHGAGLSEASHCAFPATRLPHTPGAGSGAIVQGHRAQTAWLHPLTDGTGPGHPAWDPGSQVHPLGSVICKQKIPSQGHACMGWRVTPAWPRAFRSCQEHPVRAEEAATAARHNGLSRLQRRHRLHCVRSPWGWSRRGFEWEMSWGVAPPTPGYPGFHPEGWQGKEKSLPGKIHHLCKFSGDSGAAAVAAGCPRRLCVVGVSVIFPAYGGGTHSSRGSLPSRVTLCLDGAGAVPSLQKLIRDSASLGCPLQMPKWERGRKDGYRDVARVVPQLPALPRDAPGGSKGSWGRCSWPQDQGWQELLGRVSRSPHGTAKRLGKRHRGGFEVTSWAKYRAAPANGGSGILILFSCESASPRGGGLGTNKRRWLSPSRRQPGASLARRHSPGGVCFHLPARRTSCGGMRPGLGLPCASHCCSTPGCPWGRSPRHPPGTQPPCFAVHENS